MKMRSEMNEKYLDHFNIHGRGKQISIMVIEDNQTSVQQSTFNLLIFF